MEPRESKTKKVLMIAHVFPPFRSVGHSIRVVKFIKYLPALGWLPEVLTIDDRKEYEDYLKQGSEALLSDIPHKVPIYRTASGEPSLEYLGKERALGERNRLTAMYVKIVGGARRWAFRNLALPDRRIVWLPFAVRRGRQVVRSEGVDVIFATCPPHSATLVGAFLKRLTGKPLVLDFRDDWLGTPWHYSRPRFSRMIERGLERWVVKTADRVILVTQESRNAFLDRYPAEPSDKFVFISNGCDLEDFAVLNSMPTPPRSPEFTVVHAGSLNDSENWTRTPATLFDATRRILERQPEMAEELRLVFTGFLSERLRQVVRATGLSGVVKESGFLPHDDLLRLMNAADMLLVINYEGFSTLIPGKVYEYWAVGGPPILLLSCPGAAANLLERYNLGLTVDPSDVDGVQQAILSAYRQSRTAARIRVSTAGIEDYDRRALTRELAGVLSMATCS